MPIKLESMIRRGDPGAPLLVLLHGRGADEGDLFPLGPMLAPKATVAAPRAPFPGGPWGYGGGWAWYQFLGGTSPEPESFAAGQSALDDFIQQLMNENSGMSPKLILGGFSQGGTSALAWALRHPGVAAAVLVFSGFMADHSEVRATPETVGKTRFWWGHGTADPAIPFTAAEAGWKLLTAGGANLETATYPHMGHTIGTQTLSDAADFVRRVVPSAQTRD